jgi:hypothetical protein
MHTLRRQLLLIRAPLVTAVPRERSNAIWRTISTTIRRSVEDSRRSSPPPPAPPDDNEEERISRRSEADALLGSLPWDRLNIVSGIKREDLLPYVNFKEASSGLHWPPSAREMYWNIIDGRSDAAWTLFNDILQSEHTSAKPRASIWDWYVMISFLARDPTISISEVLEFACWDQKYQETSIYRSLGHKGEIGGLLSQQQVIAFALMYGFHQRLDAAEVEVEDRRAKREEVCNEILSVWATFMKRCNMPTSRLINRLCVALIYLDRKEEVIENLVRWFRPQDEGKGIAADANAVRMDEYTVCELMHAFLLKGMHSSAYGLFSVCTGSLYKVEVDGAILNTLLGNARRAHRGYLLSTLMQKERHDGYDATSIQEESVEWESQMMWDRVPAALRATRIFKSYLFSKHPELRAISSPLYSEELSDEDKEVGGEDDGWEQGQDEEHRVEGEEPLTRAQQYLDELQRKDATRRDVADDETRRPRWDSERTPFVDAKNFDEYLQILPFVDIYEEVHWEEYLLVLAWMKRLAIMPSFFTLMRVIWAAENLTTPRDDSPGSSSVAKSLHLSLVDWIGPDSIPTKDEVTNYIKEQRRNYWIVDARDLK